MQEIPIRKTAMRAHGESVAGGCAMTTGKALADSVADFLKEHRPHEGVSVSTKTLGDEGFEVVVRCACGGPSLTRHVGSGEATVNAVLAMVRKGRRREP